MDRISCYLCGSDQINCCLYGMDRCFMVWFITLWIIATQWPTLYTMTHFVVWVIYIVAHTLLQ